MKVQTNTTIDVTLKQEAEKNGISFTECLEFGILFKLADKGVRGDYPENVLLTKIARLSSMLHEATEKIEVLENPELAKEKIDEEIKGVFGDGERE